MLQSSSSSSSSLLLTPPNPATLACVTATPRRIPTNLRRRLTSPAASSLANRDSREAVVIGPPSPHQNPAFLLRPSIATSPAISSPSATRYPGLHPPSPELGVLYLLLVISTVVGSFFTLAIVSLPTMSAFRMLEISMNKLSKVVSEEVPGTLSSLKLSGREINDLTQQLGNLRQRISGNKHGKKDGEDKPKSNGGSNNPLIV